MAAPKASFQATLVDINAVLAELSAAGLEDAMGPAVEDWIGESSIAFRAAVRANAPVGRGRPSQWQRRDGKAHGTFRRSVSRAFKRAGIDSTARVRVGPIGNIIRTGARPHFITARPGHRLFVPGARGHFLTTVRHPGTSGNDFWDRAAADIGARIEPLTRKAGFSTLNRMAGNIEARSRRR
jgi:hypothetical protein